MRLTLLALTFAFLPAAAYAQDDVCTTAINRALEASIAATGTLATATKYMTAHEDWCDGNMMALEQQDSAAVDHAWSLAIDAQSACGPSQNAQAQMNKLIVSLHNRHMKIGEHIDALRVKCN
ncbi:MAG TPA: hypothetical protein VGG10_23130 [Rhizomicrobium sp.]|jgi:hypothetical protein